MRITGGRKRKYDEIWELSRTEKTLLKRDHPLTDGWTIKGWSLSNIKEQNKNKKENKSDNIKSLNYVLLQ